MAKCHAELGSASHKIKCYKTLKSKILNLIQDMVQGDKNGIATQSLGERDKLSKNLISHSAFCILKYLCPRLAS
jgi:hypothetical protein